MTTSKSAPAVDSRRARAGPTPRPNLRQALPPWGTTALAFLAYLAYALFITWPWVTDPDGILYGVVGGDLTSGVATFQQFAEERQAPFLPGKLEQINAPEGFPTDWTVHLAAIGSSGTLWVLSTAIGSIAAHGVVAVLGFTLSAFSLFLLARTITGHAGASFVAGLAFGFWPFMYGTGWTWPHYIHLWVFVLLAWRMLVVTETPTLRNGLLAGGAAVLAMTWIQYNLLIAGVAYATLAGVALIRAAAQRRFKRQIAAQAVATGCVVVLVLGLLVAAATTGYTGVPARSETAARQGSARLEMYAVPGPRHPLFGGWTGPWLFEHFTGDDPDPPPGRAIYSEIYLGVPMLLLGFAGASLTLIGLWRRRRAALTTGPLAAGFTALVLGLVALAFSAPPTVPVFGLEVPMPYSLLEHATNVFRVAHRFAVVVMLALCLLTALALASFLRARKAAFQVIVLAVLAFVFAIDLRAQPTPRTTTVRYPAIYKLLKRQPPGIVVEYPLNREPTVLSLQSLYQEAHEHALFAGARLGSVAESRKFELQFVLAERTASDLAAYGVTYVLVHHGNRDNPPDPGETIRGLRLIGSNGNASLYRVVARPSRFTAYGIRGFHLTEGDAPGMRWVGTNDAQLELLGKCSPCVGMVTMPIASFSKPRALRIEDQRGRLVYLGAALPNGHTIRFRVRFPGRAVLHLSTFPAPAPINRVIPGNDWRPVSIALLQPIRFYPNPRAGHRALP